VEDVDDTMEEIREQMDVANEISDAISQPLGEAFDEVLLSFSWNDFSFFFFLFFDESDAFVQDELEAELQALEEETLDETLLGTTAKLPSAPQVARTSLLYATPK
jgi:charged multivesicular body protein 4